TAAMHGRLTLNPIAHVDIIWTILIPAVLLLTSGFVFGGAKPVPINPRNFKGSFRSALFWVAAAGPLMNLILALISVLLLIPAAYMPGFFAEPLVNMLLASVQINVMLALFNLLPLPPLDGGRIAVALLPPPADRALAEVERFGLIIIVLLLATGILGMILGPMMNGLIQMYLSIPAQFIGFG
ncbi:MAG: site-2 protease family protein, partial [Magnetococcales bacterium]|nr:site-2 protease family protein [Magnetococcales bacterium]